MQVFSKTKEAGAGLEHIAQHAVAHMLSEICRFSLFDNNMMSANGPG